MTFALFGLITGLVFDLPVTYWVIGFILLLFQGALCSQKQS